MRPFCATRHTHREGVGPIATPRGAPFRFGSHLTLAAILASLFVLTLPLTVHGQGVRYGYDALGRLEWAQDQSSGEVAIWLYDPAGNILQIVRGNLPDPNAPVGISGFSPTKGAAGATTVVTVFG